MKCPLLLFERYTTFEKIGSEVAVCLKEECARWDEVKLCCGDRTERLQLERLADILQGIKDKMPHVGQFTK